MSGTAKSPPHSPRPRFGGEGPGVRGPGESRVAQSLAPPTLPSSPLKPGGEGCETARCKIGAPIGERQYVSFRIDGQLFGVPVETVQEVLSAQTIARVPRARREIAGLLNLRGEIVTVVDLRRRLGLPERGGGAGMNVIVRYASEFFSLLVDDVGDVIDVAGRGLDPIPATLDPRWKGVTKGVLRLERTLLVLLDIPAVLKPA